MCVDVRTHILPVVALLLATFGPRIPGKINSNYVGIVGVGAVVDGSREQYYGI